MQSFFEIRFTFNAQIIFDENSWLRSIKALNEDFVHLDVSVNDAIVFHVKLKSDDVLDLRQR